MVRSTVGGVLVSRCLTDPTIFPAQRPFMVWLRVPGWEEGEGLTIDALGVGILGARLLVTIHVCIYSD